MDAYRDDPTWWALSHLLKLVHGPYKALKGLIRPLTALYALKVLYDYDYDYEPIESQATRQKLGSPNIP